MLYTSLIVTAAIANAMSQISLRIGMRHLRYYHLSATNDIPIVKILRSLFNYCLLIGLILFSASLFLYVIVISNVDVVVAFPAMGLTHVFVMVLSSLILREKIDAWKIAGTGMITIGLAMLAIGAR